MIPRDFLVSDRVVVAVCDSDAQWGPLLFLRPSRQQRFTLSRCAMLALVFGVVFGVLGALVLDVAARAFEQPLVPWYSFPATLVGLYFAASSLLVAPAWNRRALRLVRLERYRG
jgi:hypothetical protein